MTPRLQAIATAVPPHRIAQRDVAAFCETLFAGAFTDFRRMRGAYENAAIQTRYACAPLEWYGQPHGLAERSRLFLDNALVLIERAAVKALAAAGLDAGAIDTIITVSSTGIATPSLDARLMERLPLRRDVQRLPVFGLGCAGGVLGLGYAAALARATPGSRVLLLVVDLCTLTFRAADRSKSNVIATALFGDGAAAAIVSSEGDGVAITGWDEYCWPRSLDVMGWNIVDDGFGVLFSRDIPALVRDEMRPAAERALVRQGLALADIDEFVCHPGGAKVIDALEQAFGLGEGALGHTRAVLAEYGNMSAPTVLFVLERALAGGRRSRRLVSALGPGFTAGFVTLEDA